MRTQLKVCIEKNTIKTIYKDESTNTYYIKHNKEKLTCIIYNDNLVDVACYGYARII